ncbi:hypothetical protein ARMSODRAFT_504209 [Armillaria solidipes]|uniref:ZZ-type domain-containing protein n=1 Tax=Armillaria solidipes TaxID=1076256 RepID=A0A2H3BW63_9AGAR|nr:hypothetical protein ARMSODRAFT_504209 [Armillaria solidipes]
MKKLRAIVRIVLHPFRRRPNVSRNIDKTGDALNLNVPSGAQLDTDVGSKGMPGASNAIDGDPGDAGGMDVSHNDMDKAGDASIPSFPSGAQADADVGSKVISRMPNDIDHDPGDNAKSMSFDEWLKANQHIMDMVTEAIESLGVPEVNVQSLYRTLDTYGDISKILLKGLKIFTGAHPVSQAAFASFELVFTFEVTRRENNRKVRILRLRMQELLIAIFELRNLEDPQEILPGGKKFDAIGASMKRIGRHIERAASACDFYLSKKLIFRVINSLQYESVFADHIATLVEDRKSLMMSLEIHTAQTTDEMKTRLNSIHADVKQMSEMLLILLDTPQEQVLRNLVEKNGGSDACIEDEDAVRELLQKSSGESIEGVFEPQSGSNESWSKVKQVQEELREEMAENVKEAFEKNFERFRSSLDLQLADRIKQGNDEIIAALGAGPHNNIIDADFKELWKDMAWRKTVKAKHFVCVLHEHLIEKLGIIEKLGTSERASDENDQWMLEYLNKAHLQPLLEAVDDDATGFITIREINTFAESKPKDWTLFQWIVYWAAGWQFSVTQYKRKIYMLISEMYSIYPQVLPANRHAVIRYLRNETIFQIDKLLQSTHDPPSNTFERRGLRELAKKFTKVEEERLMDRLEHFQYDIDTERTVSLVIKPGRIERCIYPMLYLLLRRHCGVLSLSTTEILHPREIPDMTVSLQNIFSVVNQRLENLELSFNQSSVDVKEKLGNFAFGMFKLYSDNPMKEPSKNAISKYIYEQSLFDRFSEDVEQLEVTLNDLLYKPPTRASYHLPSPTLADASEVSIQEQWIGHIYDATRRSKYGLIQLTIKLPAKGILTGKAVTWKHTMEMLVNIEQNNQVTIHLDFGRFDSEDLIGQLDAEKGVIKGQRYGENGLHRVKYNEEEDEGSQQDVLDGIEKMRSGTADLESRLDQATIEGTDENDYRYTFVLRRTPTPSCLFLSGVTAGSRASALWTFALKCVRDPIRRKHFPGKYLKERFIEAVWFMILARRDRFISEDYCPRPSLSSVERNELEWLKCAIFPGFSRPYYALVIDAIDRQKYAGYDCDSCDGTIVGSRWACLTCMNDSFTDTVDLCASCVKESVELRGFVHDASHVLLKCDTFVMDADLQWIIPRARSTVVQIKKKFRSRTKIHTEPAEKSDPPSKSTQSKKKLLNVTKSPPPHCQACRKEVSLPCWVRITYYWANSENYLCDKCESRSKLPTKNSPEFGLPLLRIDEDDALEEVATVESRLAALEKKFEKFDQQLSVMTKLLEKVTGNSPSDEVQVE